MSLISGLSFVSADSDKWMSVVCIALSAASARLAENRNLITVHPRFSALELIYVNDLKKIILSLIRSLLYWTKDYFFRGNFTCKPFLKVDTICIMCSR